MELNFEMESVQKQSCLERAAGVIWACDCTIRVSWKESCNDFSSENYTDGFVRVLCITLQHVDLPEHGNSCAWTQCFPNGVNRRLSPKLRSKPLLLDQPHICPCFLILLCLSVSFCCHSSDNCTGNALGLASPFCSELCLLHNEPCGNTAKQLLRVKHR